MGVIDSFLWRDDPDGEQWWATVLGINIGEQVSATVDIVDQQGKAPSGLVLVTIVLPPARLAAYIAVSAQRHT